MSPHLSSRQISEWMIGPRGEEQERHVRECGECARAVANLEGTLAQFGESYRDCGESQTGPMRFADVEGNRGRRTPGFWWRVSVAAAVMAALAVIPVDRYHRHHAAQISAEDEALLLEIHAEVSQAVPSSLSTLADLTSSGTENGSAQ